MNAFDQIARCANGQGGRDHERERYNRLIARRVFGLAATEPIVPADAVPAAGDLAKRAAPLGGDAGAQRTAGGSADRQVAARMYDPRSLTPPESPILAAVVLLATLLALYCSPWWFGWLLDVVTR